MLLPRLPLHHHRSSQLSSCPLRSSYSRPCPLSTRYCIPARPPRRSLFACCAKKGKADGGDGKPSWAHLWTGSQDAQGMDASQPSPPSKPSSRPSPLLPRGRNWSASGSKDSPSKAGSQDTQSKHSSRSSPLSSSGSSRASPLPPSRGRSSSSSRDSASRAGGSLDHAPEHKRKHAPPSSSSSSSSSSSESGTQPSSKRFHGSSGSKPGHQSRGAPPDLATLLQRARNAVQPWQCSKALLDLGNCVRQDQRTNVHYTEQQLHEIEAAAGALSSALLGSSSSSTHAAALFQQLDSMKLCTSVWGFAMLADCTDSIKTKQLHQLVEGVAAHVVESSTLDQPAEKASMHWSRLLYSTAKLRSCQDSQPVQQLFDVAAQKFPCMLHQKQDCEPQSISNMLWAFATAEYPGSLRGLVAEVASSGAQAMEGAKPQEWSDTLWALGSMAVRGVDLGEHRSVNAIMGAGAASMAQPTRSNVEHYSKSLWGLAKAGCRPHDSITSELATAVAERASDAKPQELSNTLWALATLRCSPDPSIVRSLAAAVAERSSDAKPQELSNSLWALSQLGWYDARQIPVMVAALVHCMGTTATNAQDFSNTLQALGSLRWYDACLYSQLVEGVLLKISSDAPDEVGQQLSNTMFSCALSCHFDSSVDELAEWGSQQSLQHWNGQNVSNALYAWAILSATAGGDTASMRKLAQRLFAEASKRGVAAFQADPEWRHDMGKLFSAHQEAVCLRLPGGGVSSELLQAASSERARVVAIVSKQLRGITSAVSASLQGVYDVQPATVQGYHALLVHHPSCPRGIAIAVTHPQRDYMRHPSGRLYGKTALRVEQMKRSCDGAVMCDETEVQGKSGEQLRDMLVQRIEQAVQG